MPYGYYFLLIGGLIVVPFLTGHFVWQTIPYIALIGTSSNLLYLLRLKKESFFSSSFVEITFGWNWDFV
ncbi:hypothetical protein [Streptococcus pluranimalium]|uniref:hypothetical protein n=1 Tax=Streptococcus pluranimalium TaxID=82348 RepID=UPI003F68DB4E